MAEKIETKSWYKSKTIIFNIVVSAMVALEASFSMLQSFLPANTYAIAVVVLAVGNAMLRIVTTQGLTK